MVIKFMCYQVYGQHLDFLFMYLTTMNYDVGEKFEEGGTKCLVLDRDATLRFLGPFVDFYRVARSVVEKSN